jgi:uncharacterized protein
MRFLVWTGVEEWLTETASVELTPDGLSATGTQLGADPVPYRVDYRLDATDGFITRELELTASADGWKRHLLLRHNGSGVWDAKVEDGGTVPWPWDADLEALSMARDIDILNSPLTNTMPILRHGFQEAGSGEFTMAFVVTPTLRVAASPQGYEHIRRTDGGSVVRYLSLDSEFRADLELDSEGLLVFYPRLARRVEAGEGADQPA